MFDLIKSKGIRRLVASLAFTLAWNTPAAFAQIVILPPIPPILGGDQTPPTVSITSPQSGAVVSATISVTASASDNKGVEGVQFFLDGTFRADDTSAPYSVPWNTTTASNGSH